MTIGAGSSERLRIDSSGHIHTGYATNVTGADHVNILASDGGGVSVAQNNAGNATSGTTIGSYSFQGYHQGGATFASAEARISAIAAANHTGSSAATDLAFYTKPAATGPGSSPTERLRIGSAGQIGIAGANYGDARQVMVSNGSSAAVSWSSNPFLLDMDSLGDLDYDGVFLRYREVTVSGNGLVYLGICKSTTNCTAGRIGTPVGFVPGVAYNSQFRIDKVGITPWPDSSGHRYEHFAIISDYVSTGKLGIFYLTNSTS